MSTLTCLIRKEAVAATPEELVRQQLLHTMVQRLEYPESSIAVEKSLSQFPHLKFDKAPMRRLDVLCFAKGVQGDLYPLLLIECKAVKLTPKVLAQVCGYNYYVKAYFVAVANQHEVRFGWMDKGTKEYRFAAGLPGFHELTGLVLNS